jgi:hypothetical protein
MDFVFISDELHHRVLSVYDSAHRPHCYAANFGIDI